MKLRFPESEIHQWGERYKSGSTAADFAVTKIRAIHNSDENYRERLWFRFLKTLIRIVNSIFTFVFSRRSHFLRLVDSRHTYVRKNLRETSVKVRDPRNIYS